MLRLESLESSFEQIRGKRTLKGDDRMREDIIRYVKRQFGPTYGSRELKTLREEIMSNALERYDAELRNGSSSKEAYASAIDTLGDIKAMLKSMKIPEKQRARGLAIILPLFAAASAFIIWVSFDLDKTSWKILFILIGLTILGMPAAGLISLICGTRRIALSVIMIAVGGYLLLPLAYLALMLNADMHLSSNKKTYDLSAEIGNIVSVEYIRIDDLKYEKGMLPVQGFEYTVLRSIEPENWPRLLEQLAELEYQRPANDPPTLYRKKEMFLIKYCYPRDGAVYVLIGQSCPGYGRRIDSRVVIEYDGSWCDPDEWKAILKEYDIEWK